jgi:hypothetical protein
MPDDKQERPYLAKWAVVVPIIGVIVALLAVVVPNPLNHNTPTFGGVSYTRGPVIQGGRDVTYIGNIVQQFKTNISNTFEFIAQAVGLEVRPAALTVPPSSSAVERGSEPSNFDANAIARTLSGDGGPDLQGTASPTAEESANNPSLDFHATEFT